MSRRASDTFTRSFAHYRFVTYLLVITNCTWFYVLHRFRDTVTYPSKIANNLYLTYRYEWPRWNFGTRFGSWKLEWYGNIRWWKNFEDRLSRFDATPEWVTDRQTDRHLQSEVDKNTSKMPSSGLYSRYGWWWAGLYPYPNTTPFWPSETPTISSRIVSTIVQLSADASKMI